MRSMKPLLMVDVDGVISLFAFAAGAMPDGQIHAIDGVPHFLSRNAGEHLRELGETFELVWASGWEEKANEYLPHLLGLGAPLPCLSFERAPGKTRAHWKLDAIEEYAGSRPMAWVDDAFNEACHEWAKAREAPTLLVQTMPDKGLTANEAKELGRWAAALNSDR